MSQVDLIGRTRALGGSSFFLFSFLGELSCMQVAKLSLDRLPFNLPTHQHHP